MAMQFEQILDKIIKDQTKSELDLSVTKNNDKQIETKEISESESQVPFSWIMPQQTNPLFFKVTNNKTGAISYVLLSCHTVFYKNLHPAVKKAISTAKSLASEIEGGGGGLEMEVAEKLGYLKKRSEDDWFLKQPRKIQRALIKVLMDYMERTEEEVLDYVDRLQPWFAALLLSEKEQLLPGLMDGYLYDFFSETGKEIIGFDDFFNMGDVTDENLYVNPLREASEEDILATIEYYSGANFEKQLEHIQFIESYLAGNLSFLWERCLEAGIQANHEFITERNYNWAAQEYYVSHYMQSPVLRVFGAGHGPGPEGMLNILKHSDNMILKMAVDGQFYPFEIDEPPVCSIQQFLTMKRNYIAFRNQILEPEKPAVSWLYSMARNQVMAQTMVATASQTKETKPAMKLLTYASGL